MAHKLFDGKTGAHGPLHGGLLGRDPNDPLQHPMSRVTLDEAVRRGYVSLPTAVPPSVDFATQPWWTPSMEQDDQGQLGACVSFAADHMRRFLSLQQGHADQKHSQLWIYYNMRARFEPQQINQDTGAYGSWAEAIMEGRGFALEADWPYDITKFTVAPPSTSYPKALWYRNVVTVTVPLDVPSMKALLAGGHAFMVGYTVCQSFYQAQDNGDVPLPPAGDKILGGHENFVMGYQDGTTYPDGKALPAGAGGYLIFLNQWGSGPGSWFTPRNRLYVPYSFVTARAPDGSGPMVMDCTCLALAQAPPV